MKSFILSWVFGVGANSHGGKIDEPTWNEVSSILDQALNGFGSVTLYVKNAPDVGPNNLKMESGGNGSIIMLGEDTEDDYVVRTYDNGKEPSGDIDVMGNYYDSTALCEDRKLIQDIFKQFYVYGDVSTELLK